jgi:hypothetical protein
MTVEGRWQGKTEVLGEEPVLISPRPQILLWLPYDSTLTSTTIPALDKIAKLRQIPVSLLIQYVFLYCFR